MAGKLGSELTGAPVDTRGATEGESLVVQDGVLVPGHSSPEWMAYLAHRLDDETAHVDDDFFDDGSIGFTTELDVTGTSTWKEARGLLSVKADDQLSGDVAAQLKSITSASSPMTIEMSFHFSRIETVLAIGGIEFADGVVAGSNVVRAFFYMQSGGVLRWSFADGDHTTFPVAFDDISFGGSTTQERWYVQLIWAATNSWKARFSIDGVTWHETVAAQSSTMTPTHFGVWVSTFGGTDAMLAAFDYFRVYDSDESL